MARILLIQQSVRPLLTLLIFMISIPSVAQTPMHQVVVSLTDQQNVDAHWSERMCLGAFKGLQTTIDVSSTCLPIPGSEISVTLDPRVRQIREAGRHQLYLHVQRVNELETWVRVVNFQQHEDDLDFREVTVHFRRGDAQNEISVRRLAANLSHYLRGKNAFKARLVAEGLHHSTELTATKDGRIIRSLDGSAPTAREAYEIFKNESPKTKAYVRASLELAAVFGFALYKYHGIESNRADQDYPGSFWTNLKLKLRGRASGMDDNNSAANIGHVGAGIVYYEIFRSAGSTPLEATLFTIASSAAWEYAFEYREIMSRNDMILTGVAGAAAGEVMHKISLAIRNKTDSWVGKTFAALVNPVGTLNDALAAWSGDKRVFPRTGELDERLFSRFELSLGWIQVDRGVGNETSALKLGVSAEVYEIDLFHAPGKSRRLLMNAPSSKLELQFSDSKMGTEDFRFLARQVLAAYYRKELRRDRTGELEGYEILVGAGSAFEWDQSRSGPLDLESSVDPDKDMIANTHVAEGTVEAFGFYKGIRFQIAMEISGDFALVRSLALDDFVAVYGTEGLLPVVKRRGYYYGSGWSQGASAQVSYGRWSAQAYAKSTQLTKSGSYHRGEETAPPGNVGMGDSQVRGGSAFTFLINKTTSASFYCIRRLRQSEFAEFLKSVKTRECGAKLTYIF